VLASQERVPQAYMDEAMSVHVLRTFCVLTQQLA